MEAGKIHYPVRRHLPLHLAVTLPRTRPAPHRGPISNSRRTGSGCALSGTVQCSDFTPCPHESLLGHENETLVFIVDGDAKLTKETHSEQWYSGERVIVDEVHGNILDDRLSHLD